jgi:hypothetical protein
MGKTATRIFATVALLCACGESPGSVEDPLDADATVESETTPDVEEQLDGDALDSDEVDTCDPGERVCVTARSYMICDDLGVLRETVQCEGELGCLEGECIGLICRPHEIRGCLGDHTLEVCNFSGTAWVPEECPTWWTCEEGRCNEPPCVPGHTRCEGLDLLLTCDEETFEYVELEQCPDGEACYDDECLPLCEINKKLRDYVGCEYRTVDLDNLGEAETILHTVVLSNPSDDLDARIDVELSDGTPLDLPDSVVPAGGQLVIRFPYEYGLIRPGITDWSWTITSTLPVTAHQFNPLDNFTDPFTNDGTLLLPTHALGERYYAASWIHREVPQAPLNGFIVIVATDRDGSDIMVRAAARTLWGETEPVMEPGEERTFFLEQGQTLMLQTAGIGDDLTGTFIESAGGDIAVFGGHECANVILGVDRCDHMEAQLLPIELLRSEYVAVKYATRVEGLVRSEPDYWRILAVEGATFIRTNPEIAGVDGSIIASGEYVDVVYRDDFIITADHPVLVAHYMVGSNWPGIERECFDDTGPPTGIGDPAMTQLVPIDQFRSDYLVLTPFAYVEDYLNLAVPTEAVDTVVLDGESVDAERFEPVGDGTWSAARIRVQDGPHRVSADVPFGLDAYGYSCHVSYAYPGGMRLDDGEDERE